MLDSLPRPALQHLASVLLDDEHLTTTTYTSLERKATLIQLALTSKTICHAVRPVLWAHPVWSEEYNWREIFTTSAGERSNALNYLHTLTVRLEHVKGISGAPALDQDAWNILSRSPSLARLSLTSASSHVLLPAPSTVLPLIKHLTFAFPDQTPADPIREWNRPAVNTNVSLPMLESLEISGDAGHLLNLVEYNHGLPPPPAPQWFDIALSSQPGLFPRLRSLVIRALVGFTPLPVDFLQQIGSATVSLQLDLKRPWRASYLSPYDCVSRVPALSHLTDLEEITIRSIGTADADVITMHSDPPTVVLEIQDFRKRQPPGSDPIFAQVTAGNARSLVEALFVGLPSLRRAVLEWDTADVVDRSIKRRALSLEKSEEPGGEVRQVSESEQVFLDYEGFRMLRW